MYHRFLIIQTGDAFLLEHHTREIAREWQCIESSDAKSALRMMRIIATWSATLHSKDLEILTFDATGVDDA